MIDKETFRKTEKKLYTFYEQEEVVKSLNFKIERLQQQVKDIEADIRSNNVVIDTESKSTSYDERVQTSSIATSYVERALIHAIELLEKEREYKLSKISELQTKIRQIEEESAAIEYNIKMLSKEDLHFIELKYKRKMKVWQIGVKLEIPRSTAYEQRKRIVDDIAKWCDLIK